MTEDDDDDNSDSDGNNLEDVVMVRKLDIEPANFLEESSFFETLNLSSLLITADTLGVQRLYGFLLLATTTDNSKSSNFCITFSWIKEAVSFLF